MPGHRETSGPDAFDLGMQLGEMRAALERIEQQLGSLPCTEHQRHIAELRAEQMARQWPAWLRDWRLVVPLALALLGAPTVRQCIGEQRAEQIAAAVRRLEQRPAIAAPKRIMTPDGG